MLHDFDTNYFIAEAIELGNLQILDLLLRYGVEVYDYNLICSIRNNQYELTELILDQKITLYYYHINLCPDLKMMKLLLDHGAKITDQNIVYRINEFSNDPDMLYKFIKLMIKYDVDIRTNQDFLLQYCISTNMMTNCSKLILKTLGTDTKIIDTNNKSDIIRYVIKNGSFPE